MWISRICVQIGFVKYGQPGLEVGKNGPAWRVETLSRTSRRSVSPWRGSPWPWPLTTALVPGLTVMSWFFLTFLKGWCFAWERDGEKGIPLWEGQKGIANPQNYPNLWPFSILPRSVRRFMRWLRPLFHHIRIVVACSCTSTIPNECLKYGVSGPLRASW